MQIEQNGMSNIISVEQAKTLDGLFKERVQRSPQAVAYRYFDPVSDQWRSHTWEQMNQHIARWQVALTKESLVPGDRVAVMMRNCPEWVMFEQAAMGLGLVVIPLYVDDRVENATYVINDATVKLLLLENSQQWRQFLTLPNEIEGLQRVVILRPFEPDSVDACDNVRVVSAMEWLSVHVSEVRHIDSDPDSLATIIYTSGTSGRPKGVMLSHHNILSNAFSCLQVIPVLPEDVLLSFLPLSHTFERTAGYYVPMMTGATIAYARSIPQLQDDLVIIRPTIMISVPRIYERVYAGIQAKLAEGPGFARWLFNFAVAVGYSRFECQQGRGYRRLSHVLWPLLKKWVADKVMGKLGGRLRMVMSGGAALSPQVSRVFIGLGLPILQGYGMTESSPVVCANRLEDNVPASVGLPIPGVEVKLGESNALLIRGPNVMLGYWNNPEATQAVISSDGWLNSGDIASIDDQGHVTITGRLKEIIVLSTGEKVPPTDMEAAILRDPLFEQVMLIGESRSYLSVLVVLNPARRQEFMAHYGLGDDLTNEQQRQQAEEILLEKITRQTSEFPGYAKIRRVAVAQEPWSVENGLLTPTLKLKREKVLEKYNSEIERLYAGH
ncbi:AMP-dependent synthetase/ligase [Nitrosomonas ureae]|uniref:Long-chain acyl-CoA synthetase n=1 Tax=Nitrosomonas ureae TaxID=44577 RepID=A0A1H2F9Y2_9PROT|nr:long-chain fatty acid--CoA ligase [Nitrosomonas ureae]ALQ52109.1 AMP-dependent synthetase [Nitrosomonas ureae]SDU04206.1 long-chain acyl-CoA synthetase [Nitrosomonas ureae]